jgi:hypothetical protein
MSTFAFLSADRGEGAGSRFLCAPTLREDVDEVLLFFFEPATIVRSERKGMSDGSA